MSIYNNTDNIHPPICCRYETVLQILNTMLCKRRDVMIISAFISSPCSSNIMQFVYSSFHNVMCNHKKGFSFELTFKHSFYCDGRFGHFYINFINFSIGALQFNFWHLNQKKPQTIKLLDKKRGLEYSPKLLPSLLSISLSEAFVEQYFALSVWPRC